MSLVALDEPKLPFHGTIPVLILLLCVVLILNVESSFMWKHATVNKQELYYVQNWKLKIHINRHWRIMLSIMLASWTGLCIYVYICSVCV